MERYTGKIQLKTKKGYEDLFSASSNTLAIVKEHTKKSYVFSIFPGLEERDTSKARVIITDTKTNTVLTEKDWE